MRYESKNRRLVLAALFLALAYVMPFLTGQIPEIGSMLCPMHIPVLLCGFICGWRWGLAVGTVATLLRALSLGMPPLFPTAVCMAFELGAYGAVAGLCHRLLPPKKPFVYLALLIAMTVGRLVWGGAMFVFVGARGGEFPISAFLAGAVTNTVPGILLQLVLIPVLVVLIENPRVLKPENREEEDI